MSFDDEDVEPDDPDLLDDEQAPCPHCGAEIYADAVQCPVCQTYVSWDTGPFAGRSPRWVLLCKVGVSLALLGMLGAILLPLLFRLLGH